MINNAKLDATTEDQSLLAAVHPFACKLLTWVGERYAVKRLPRVGVIVSDATMIREIFMDKEWFTKNGPGASTSFWNPIVGETGLLNMDGMDHMKLKRVLGPIFSKTTMRGHVQTHNEDFKQLEKSLQNEESVDIAEVASIISFKASWRISGLPEELLTVWDKTKTIEELREVTHGINPFSKKMPAKRVAEAKNKLSDLEDLTRLTYLGTPSEGTVIHAMKEAGYPVEDIITMVDVLMIAGTETMNSFLPRMTALFIRSNSFPGLQESPGLIPASIEEALRVTVPTPVAARVAKEDGDFHGVELHKGDRLILNSFIACRKLGSFDLHREMSREVKGLWFGAGTHMCLGIALALEVSQYFVETLTSSLSHRKPYMITTATKATSGHTGAYKELIIV